MKNKFNKVIHDCVKNKDLFIEDQQEQQNLNSHKKEEEEYQASFSNILDFQKQVPQKDDIEVIIYNENNDGFLSAFIAWEYLVVQKKKTQFKIMITKPSSSKNEVSFYIKKMEADLKGKKVLFVDLSYDEITLNYLKEICSSVIIIEDHKKEDQITIEPKNNFYSYIGSHHGSCAYVWKFFNPEKPVPLMVIYTDSKDRSLQLGFIKYANFFTQSIGFRYVHNKEIPRDKKVAVLGGTFEEFNEHFQVQDVNFWIFIGKYMSEVSSNEAGQIAANAHIANFQGYKVGVLNFDAPNLAKNVGRQIIQKFKRDNNPVDFAVTWGYQYTQKAYRVQMFEDETTGQPKYNLPELAQRLGRLGGTRHAGFGSRFIGTFFWPNDKNKNIWSLFEKKF